MNPFPVVQYPRWLKPQYGTAAALAQIGLAWLLPQPLPAITGALLFMYAMFGWGYQHAAGRHYIRGMRDAFDFARKIDAAFLEVARQGLSLEEASAAVKEKLGVSEEPKH